MMLAPHGGKYGIAGWGPFFSVKGFDLRSGGIWYHDTGRVMIDMLALEMVFLAVLFAVVVNIRWRRKPSAEKPHQENPHHDKPLQARDWLSPAGIFTAAVIAVAVLTILYVLVRMALQR